MSFHPSFSAVVWLVRLMAMILWNIPNSTLAQTTLAPGFFGDLCVGHGSIVGSCRTVSCPHLQQDLKLLSIPEFIAKHRGGCDFDIGANLLFCCPLEPTPPHATTSPSSIRTRPSAPTPSPVALPGEYSTNALESSGISNVDITGRKKCNANSGAIGMYTTEEGLVFLICKQALNLMPFSVDDPKSACHYPKEQQKCMTANCGSNLYRGFVLATFPSQGPCSGAFRPDQAKIDPLDCHTVSGSRQERPAMGYSWQDWRLCRGDSTSYISFYAMTGAVVTKKGDKWSIPSITCCRIKDSS